MWQGARVVGNETGGRVRSRDAARGSRACSTVIMMAYLSGNLNELGLQRVRLTGIRVSSLSQSQTFAPSQADPSPVPHINLYPDASILTRAVDPLLDRFSRQLRCRQT